MVAISNLTTAKGTNREEYMLRIHSSDYCATTSAKSNVFYLHTVSYKFLKKTNSLA